MPNISEWITEKSNSDWWIYIKRLSANDTGLTGGHQVGIYTPSSVMENLFPSISHSNTQNPDCYLRARVTSHSLPEQTLRAIYYNNRYFGGSRNEKRITRWNSDITNSPLQNPDSTGGLAVFAFFAPSQNTDSEFLDVWFCNSLEEEEIFESLFGEVIPGKWSFERGDLIFGGFTPSTSEKTSNIELPPLWLEQFPSGSEIIEYLNTAFRFKKNTPDELIMERREAEFKLFRQLEEAHVLSDIQKGFNSVDDFIKLANSVSNRRKSRSGRSLEIHLEDLFNKYGLTHFGTQCVTEGRKKPDFLFPSCEAYHNSNYPEENLRMLAVKTTCKDRWRQTLNEANRIDQIHLFTLQEGVSQNQFSEMQTENVTLVVPKPLHKKYPEEIRGQILSLENFIHQTKEIYA